MRKFMKIEAKSLSLWLVIGFLGILTISGLVAAYVGGANTVIEECNNCTFESNGTLGGEVIFGASGTRFPNGISADSTSPSAGQVRGTTLTITDSEIVKLSTTGGGAVNSTSTVEGGDVTILLVQSDLENFAYIEYLNLTDTSAVTFTLPATSTMIALLPEVGSTREWLIHNATSTADGSPTLTIVTGDGMNLVGTGSGSDVIDEEVWIKMTCVQKTYISSVDENITCMLEEMVAVD